MLGIIIGIIIFIAMIGCIIWLGVAFRKERPKSGIIGSVLSFIMLIAFIFIPFGIQQINTGEIAVVKVWGEAVSIKTAGLSFRNIVSTEYIIYDLKTQEIISDIEAYSQDAQPLTAILDFQYRIKADKVINITTEFGTLEIMEQRIKVIAEEKVKTLMSTMQAMSIIETRQTLSSRASDSISTSLNAYYVDIINIVISDVCFSSAFEDAVEQKMISEQSQLQAEYEKERLITQAEAQLEVARKEAEAVAVKAEGDAEALQIMTDAWSGLSAEVKEIMLKQLAIEAWDGAMPETLVGSEFIQWLFGYLQG